jgi:SAM-dependent methyltransferase
LPRITEFSTIAARLVPLIRPLLWDVSQKIFGADKEKERLYFEALDLKSRHSPLLDFGCATGNASFVFVGYNYTGIDIDEQLIALARLKFRMHPEMKFVAEDIATFDAGHSFDYILFAGVAHHLDDVLLRTILRRLRSLLSETGYIYFIDPVITSDEGPLLRFLMSLDQGKYHRAQGSYELVFQELGFQVFDYRRLAAQRTLFPTPVMDFFKVR